MQHFVTEMCTFLLQNAALWDMEQSNQWWPSSLTHTCIIRLQWVKVIEIWWHDSLMKKTIQLGHSFAHDTTAEFTWCADLGPVWIMGNKILQKECIEDFINELINTLWNRSLEVLSSWNRSLEVLSSIYGISPYMLPNSEMSCDVKIVKI